MKTRPYSRSVQYVKCTIDIMSLLPRLGISLLKTDVMYCIYVYAVHMQLLTCTVFTFTSNFPAKYFCRKAIYSCRFRLNSQKSFPVIALKPAAGFPLMTRTIYGFYQWEIPVDFRSSLQHFMLVIKYRNVDS